eukprot:gene2730-biopygen6941
MAAMRTQRSRDSGDGALPRAAGRVAGAGGGAAAGAGAAPAGAGGAGGAVGVAALRRVPPLRRPPPLDGKGGGGGPSKPRHDSERPTEEWTWKYDCCMNMGP